MRGVKAALMLPMAGCAIGESRFFLGGEVGERRHVPIDQIGGVEVRHGLGHLRRWNQMFLRLAVTREAPRHLHFHGLVGHRHLIDSTVATHTRNAPIDVRAVIEIDVIGNARHLLPDNRLGILSAVSNGLQQRGIRPDLRVTGHAGFRRWNAGVRRRVDARVAVTAIDSQFSNVVLMAERYWLLRCDIDLLPGGALPILVGNEQGHDGEECPDGEHGSKQVIMLGRKNKSGVSLISLRFHG